MPPGPTGCGAAAADDVNMPMESIDVSAAAPRMFASLRVYVMYVLSGVCGHDVTTHRLSAPAIS